MNEQSAASGFAVLAQSGAKVVDVDYSQKITIEGKRAQLAVCRDCGTTPHVEMKNGNLMCAFCGLEHS